MTDDTTKQGAPEEGEPEPQRMTINVVGTESCARFTQLALRSKCATTDELVNRALVLYEFMFNEFVSGSEFFIMREGDKQAQKLSVFNVYKNCPQCGNQMSIEAGNCDNCGLLFQ